MESEGKKRIQGSLSFLGFPGLVSVPGPSDILGALLAELRRVFIFKGSWFALTLGVLGGVAWRNFIFICKSLRDEVFWLSW